jgi:hypothetical protein
MAPKFLNPYSECIEQHADCRSSVDDVPACCGPIAFPDMTGLQPFLATHVPALETASHSHRSRHRSPIELRPLYAIAQRAAKYPSKVRAR